MLVVDSTYGALRILKRVADETPGRCRCGCGGVLVSGRVIRGHQNSLRQKLVWEVMESGCWEWQGQINNSGYGRASWGVPAPGKGNGRASARGLAHRLVFEYLTGLEIPEGMVLDHTCENRICVNPEHLEIVTQGENTRRAGTLTREQIVEVREAAKRVPISELGALASEYGVAPLTIVNLVLGEHRPPGGQYQTAQLKRAVQA